MIASISDNSSYFEGVSDVSFLKNLLGENFFLFSFGKDWASVVNENRAQYKF